MSDFANMDGGRGKAKANKKVNANKKGGENKDNNLNNLFKNNGGADKKKAGKKGGVNISPFVAALALLGTRLLNDEQFMRNANLNVFKASKSSKSVKKGGEQAPVVAPPAAPVAPAVVPEGGNGVTFDSMSQGAVNAFKSLLPAQGGAKKRRTGAKKAANKKAAKK